MSNARADPVSWALGQHLIARGRRWTLDGLESGTDCTAVRLNDETMSAATRTLLWPFDRLVPSAEHPAPKVIRIRRWLRFARHLAADSHPAGTLRAAAAAGIRLLAYQLEPALAVARTGAARILIADEVGLGKTVQAGLIAAELVAETPSARTLVLVPAGLRNQWREELARLFTLSSIAADSAWLRTVTAERPADANPWALPGIYVASQDFIKQPEVLRPLEDVEWDLLVVDEAHGASARSDRRAAADAVARRSRRVVLLTATPHADDPAEHEALCAIGRLDPDEGPILLFRRSRRDVRPGPARRSRLLAVHPSEAEARMHRLLEEYTRRVWRESGTRGDRRARLAVLVLRKRALSSAASLASSIRHRMALLVGSPATGGEQLRLPIGDEEPLDDEVPGEVLGAPGMADAGREHRWLALIAEVAQRAACDETKTRFLRRLLGRIREPAIVFTEYRDTMARLRQALTDPERSLLLLHGGMSPAERSSVQREFNESPAVLLATDAAAEGLNLHARCRVVVHYELPWSLSRLEQRVGRVDRMGQQRRVHEAALVAASTAERLVLAPLLKRAAHARSKDAGSGGWPAVLTELQVADRIIGGEPQLLHEGSSTPEGERAASRTTAIDLGVESAAEAGRLAAIRAMAVPLGGRSRRSRRPLASTTRGCSRLPRGLVLIYRLSLSAPSHLRLHDVPVAISLQTSLPRSLSAGRVRALVQPFADTCHPVLSAVLSQFVRQALDLAVPIHRRSIEAHRSRHRLMQHARSSAARQLVQAGLFDRRWRRETVWPEPCVASVVDPAHSQTAVVGIELRLVGAVQVIAR